MKKLLAIVLSVLMVMSVMCVNTLAVAEETEVWEQNFEGDLTPLGDYAAQGGTVTNIFIQGNADDVVGASSETVLAGKRVKLGTESSDAVIIKLYVDNKVLEEGATYKFTAKVMHKASGNARNITVKPLKDTGYNAYPNASKATSVDENEWTEVSSHEFIYKKSNLAATNGSLNVRFELAKFDSDTLDQRFYVDDVKLIKVVKEDEKLPNVTGSVFESYVLGETWDFENLSYNVLRHTSHATDQDTDTNGVKYIVNDPTGEENMVLRGAGAKSGVSNPRNELIGFLKKAEVIGNTYKISFKLYPQGTSTLNIRAGLKGDKGSTSDVPNIAMFELVNGTDFVANQWNNIAFTVTAPSNLSKNFFFDQRGGTDNAFVADNSFDYLYVDDIKIEIIDEAGDSYFKNMATDTKVVRDFEDTPELITGVDYKSGSSGFGSISIANEGYNSNHSLKISGRTVTSGRYKLLDAFKDAPVGSMYKISAYIKIADENEEASPFVSIGVMSNEVYQDSCYSKFEVNRDSWTKCELVYIVSHDSSGNVMDEISIEQSGLGSRDVVVDTIYIDDLAVEPITDNVAAYTSFKYVKNSSGNSSDVKSMAVKFNIDSAAFAGAQNPVMIIAGYDAEGVLVGTDVVAYDGSSTEYIGYVDNIKTVDIASAKAFLWDGASLTPVAATVNLK